MRERNLFIDGRWQPTRGGRRFAINDPATGEPVGSTAVANAQDIDAAVTAAERAFPGWAATHPDAPPEFCIAPPTSSPTGCRQSPIF